MGTAVAGGATVLLVSVVWAGTAGAKGPESVTITGPGVDEPIEIPLPGSDSRQDGTPPYLVVALTELADPYYAKPGIELSTDPPTSGRLNDGYTLIWQMSRPPDADPADYQLVQDVYPDAQFGGPYIHTHSGPYGERPGGWYEAPPALRDTLAALGVPVSGLPRGLADPPRTVAPPPEPAAAERWWLPVAAIAGLAAGLGLGVPLAQRRARRHPIPSVPAAANPLPGLPVTVGARSR